MSIERFVTFIAHPVLVAVAALLCGIAAKYGLNLDQTQVAALATSGAVTAAAGVVTFLKGRQNPEILKLEADAKATLAKLPPGLRGELETWIKAEVVKGQQEVVKVITGHTQPAAAPAQPQTPAQVPAQTAQPTA